MNLIINLINKNNSVKKINIENKTGYCKTLKLLTIMFLKLVLLI